jgi:hypothetical protein
MRQCHVVPILSVFVQYTTSRVILLTRVANPDQDPSIENGPDMTVTYRIQFPNKERLLVKVLARSFTYQKCMFRCTSGKFFSPFLASLFLQVEDLDPDIMLGKFRIRNQILQKRLGQAKTQPLRCTTVQLHKFCRIAVILTA